MPHHVLGHAGLTDLDAQFEQFPVDVGRSPQRVFAAHPADQIADLAGNGGPTHPAVPDLPSPEKAKSPAMPSDRGRGFHDVQRRAPLAPDLREENPKQTVGCSQLRPFSGRPLQDPDLVPESDVLQLQRVLFSLQEVSCIPDDNNSQLTYV